jgi:hypothetical protein
VSHSLLSINNYAGKHRPLPFLLLSALFAFAALPARADTLSIDWFTVSNTAPDFPAASAAVFCQMRFRELSWADCNDPSLTFVNGSNQLQWWTPGTYVTATGSGVLTLPINQNMFITNGTGNNDASGFQTAILRGTAYRHREPSRTR